ncbi:OFA family oxalate/formate antiporter-like MFS transporter [Gelidibacter sediminis]|uniref:OFA family oxalate/formate antiporter-like MFS transporter n=1 Tax=Gelidibacter sediminis TaxID=1608710 RepID=A0A4R7PKI4_9FLAO|nr:MFS transporter [Gelidibacter sediminis]TDU34472.1 OFA family oxalate/formate antiporter-like MFS transporter [Gelidibacter sediminis]
MIKTLTNRWFIAIMGTLLQLVLGTVYAWSYFQKPIIIAYGWSNVQTMWIFSLSILFLGLSAALGGIILPKYGPKKLASIGALLYGLGYLLSAYAMQINSLALFYIGFGGIGGMGLGLGYVTPVATVSKWFPDKKGFVTGMVVMGFGLGALFMSKLIAPTLIRLTEGNMIHVFFYIALVVLAIGVPAGLCMQNPPNNFSPEGFVVADLNIDQKDEKAQFTLYKSLISIKFLGMWFMFFLNISAGIIFIGLQSPMIQDLFKSHDKSMSTEALAMAGGSLIAISALFNGVGRFFWGGLSDKIGQIEVFRWILGSQIVAFLFLINTTNPWIFGSLVCYVLLCYGGGFGAMPSYILEVFKARHMPIIYGVILTAWSFGGIVGPQMAAFIRDFYATSPEMIGPRTYMAGIVLLSFGFLISLRLSNAPITPKS